ncbi:MAG: SH3 domain-containing protein [Gammaproteobacteria bacterium]
MRRFLSILCLLLASFGAEAKPVAVTVDDPYLEMHTGPGRGYPVFHVVDKGESVEVLRQRTDWFRVTTRKGKRGWVHRDQMERTLQADGARIKLEDEDFGSFSNRRWEMGFTGGDFGGANVVSIYGSFALSPNLSTELSVSKGLGSFSDSEYANLNVVHTLYPEKRISPMFTLGTGVIRTQPSATLVATEDRTDQTAHVGVGLRAYLTRQFVFRLEYKSYVVFTSRDDNEEIDEWKAGLSFFL